MSVDQVEPIGRRPGEKPGELVVHPPPAIAGIAGQEEPFLGRGDDAIGVFRVDGEVVHGRGRGPLLPCAATVARHHESPLEAIKAVDPVPSRAQDVEVGFAQQGDAVPGPAAVARLDEPEMRREVLSQSRMAGADHAVVVCDREAHEVLSRLARALGRRLTLGGREETVVGRDEEGSVFAIQTEAVDVAGLLHGGGGTRLLARREARRRKLRVEPLETMALILIAAALVGARAFYLAEHGQLLDPSRWLGTNGFTFYGGFIAAGVGIALYIWRRRLSLYYLDAIAVAVPLGLAVGRIGDVINGEHYGPRTDFFLGVRNTHPDALTPSPEFAYHSGGLYEVLLGLAIFAIVWPLRRRLRQPTAMVWLVLALLAAGRFLEFFARSDSDTLALGLVTAQWVSLGLLAVAGVGAWLTLRHGARTRVG